MLLTEYYLFFNYLIKSNHTIQTTVSLQMPAHNIITCEITLFPTAETVWPTPNCVKSFQSIIFV